MKTIKDSEELAALEKKHDSKVQELIETVYFFSQLLYPKREY